MPKLEKVNDVFSENLGDETQRKYTILDKKEFGLKRYECMICGARHGSTGNIKHHLLHVHNHAEKGKEQYKCLNCDFVHCSAEKIRKHELKEHGSKENWVKCKSCEYKSYSNSTVEAHNKMVHLRIRYPCDNCGWTGQSAKSVENHKLVTHEGFRYKCEFCPYSITTPQALGDHNRAYHVKTECDKCQNIISGTMGLKDHMNTEHGSTRIYCSNCDFYCSKKVDLKEHTNIWHRIRLNLQCTDCDFKCKEKTPLLLHMRKKHPKKINPKKCSECDFTSTDTGKRRKDIMRLHLIDEHLSNNQDFKEARKFRKPRNQDLLECKECMFETYTKSIFYYHQRNHKKENIKPTKQEKFREKRKTLCLEKVAIKEEFGVKIVKREENFETKTARGGEHEEGELVSVNGVDNNFVNIFFVV